MGGTLPDDSVEIKENKNDRGGFIYSIMFLIALTIRPAIPAIPSTPSMSKGIALQNCSHMGMIDSMMIPPSFLFLDYI